MIVRRVCSILLATLALHSSIASFVFACADGSSHRSSAVAAAAGEHEHHTSPTDTPEPHDAGCDATDLSECCPLMSCNSPAFGAEVVEIVTADPRQTRTLFLASAPLSRITSPDPPPPRT